MISSVTRPPTVPSRRRLKAEHFRMLFGDRWREHAREIVPVEATDVRLWLDKNVGEGGRVDLPSFVPPWPLAWVQFDMPVANAKQSPSVYVRPDGTATCGVMVMSTPFEEHTAIDRIVRLSRYIDRALGRMGSLAFREHELYTGQRAKIKVRWPRPAYVCGVSTFFHNSVTNGWDGAAGTIYGLRDDGLHDTMVAFTPAMSQRSLSHDLIHMSTCAFTAFAFAHCKNVVVEAPASERRRAMGKGSGEVAYRTLDVRPVMRRVKDGEAGEAGGDEVSQAFHLVRGHFKEFKEKGLFGRHKGVYWWDMAARGDKKHGEVVKTYKMKTT